MSAQDKAPKSPMLAASTDGKGLVLPMYGSPKLDGVRAIVQNGVVLSRKFKPIPNRHVQFLFGGPEHEGLDGELIVGNPTAKDCYRQTVSGVMSEAGKPEVAFHIFDDFTQEDWSFEGRYKSVLRRLPAKSPVLRAVPHMRVDTEDQLLRLEEVILAQGFEGVILRAPSGKYKWGRSTLNEGWMLKLKRFEDGEAVIMGFEELEHNLNQKLVGRGGQLERSHKKEGMLKGGVLGALQVKDLKTKVEFSLGSGFTQKDREQFWLKQQKLLGKVVKYKHFPLGAKDKPRFPTFQGFRHPLDL